jgi:hypothetical protein
MADRQQLVALRNWIVDNLDREQIVTLAGDVGVNYDHLGGSAVPAKVRELIGYLERRGQVDVLIEAVERLRADPSTLARGRTGLPERCPSCNAPLRPDGVKWYTPTAVQCAYCGSTVRAGNQG